MGCLGFEINCASTRANNTTLTHLCNMQFYNVCVIYMYTVYIMYTSLNIMAIVYYVIISLIRLLEWHECFFLKKITD